MLHRHVGTDNVGILCLWPVKEDGFWYTISGYVRDLESFVGLHSAFMVPHDCFTNVLVFCVVSSAAMAVQRFRVVYWCDGCIVRCTVWAEVVCVQRRNARRRGRVHHRK